MQHQAGKALIAQNKGGGHGELGYHLALKLSEKDITVTLLQDGAGKNKDKQPFARLFLVQATSVAELLPIQAISPRIWYEAQLNARAPAY